MSLKYSGPAHSSKDILAQPRRDLLVSRSAWEIPLPMAKVLRNNSSALSIRGSRSRLLLAMSDVGEIWKCSGGALHLDKYSCSQMFRSSAGFHLYACKNRSFIRHQPIACEHSP